jgi:hypothetical protein
MHQEDRVPVSRLVADVDPMAVTLNCRLLKGHASCSIRSQLGHLLTLPGSGLASSLPDRYSIGTRVLITGAPSGIGALVIGALVIGLVEE